MSSDALPGSYWTNASHTTSLPAAASKIAVWHQHTSTERHEKKSTGSRLTSGSKFFTSSHQTFLSSSALGVAVSINLEAPDSSPKQLRSVCGPSASFAVLNSSYKWRRDWLELRHPLDVSFLYLHPTMVPPLFAMEVSRRRAFAVFVLLLGVHCMAFTPLIKTAGLSSWNPNKWTQQRIHRQQHGLGGVVVSKSTLASSSSDEAHEFWENNKGFVIKLVIPTSSLAGKLSFVSFRAPIVSRDIYT